MISQKIIRFSGKAGVFSYYALIFFLPISVALAESFASFTLFFFFVKRGTLFALSCREAFRMKASLARVKMRKVFLAFLRIVRPERSVLSRPLGFFTLVCGASILVSQYPVLSLKGFFFKVLQWTYLYFVFIEFIRERRHLRNCIIAFSAISVLVLANGIYQIVVGKDFILGHPYENRVYSCFRHANDFGGYLIFALCFFIVNFFNGFKKPSEQGIRPGRPWVFLSLFFIAYFCLGMTFSRGAWVGVLFALVFLGIKSKKYFFYLFAFHIIFLLIFNFYLSQKRHVAFLPDLNALSDLVRPSEGQHETVRVTAGGALPDDSLARKDEPAKTAAGGSLPERSFWSRSIDFLDRMNTSDRLLYWREAIRMIRGAPWLGRGINTYSQVARSNPSGTGGYPHNCYLQMAVEIGLLGLGTFLWAMIAFFQEVSSRLKTMTDSFLRLICLAFSAGLFGFLVHSFFDTNFYSVQLGNFMWVVMGMIVAAQRVDRDQQGKVAAP